MKIDLVYTLSCNLTIAQHKIGLQHRSDQNIGGEGKTFNLKFSLHTLRPKYWNPIHCLAATKLLLTPWPQVPLHVDANESGQFRHILFHSNQLHL